jgi:hypothetical protein
LYQTERLKIILAREDDHSCLGLIQNFFPLLSNAGFSLAPSTAQEMLRHADVQVTAAHYVENKQRSVLGFGHLLTKDRTIIPIAQEKSD